MATVDMAWITVARFHSGLPPMGLAPLALPIQSHLGSSPLNRASAAFGTAY